MIGDAEIREAIRQRVIRVGSALSRDRDLIEAMAELFMAEVVDVVTPDQLRLLYVSPILSHSPTYLKATGVVRDTRASRRHR
jgi:hypothetical protein